VNRGQDLVIGGLVPGAHGLDYHHSWIVQGDDMIYVEEFEMVFFFYAGLAPSDVRKAAIHGDPGMPVRQSDRVASIRAGAKVCPLRT